MNKLDLTTPVNPTKEHLAYNNAVENVVYGLRGTNIGMERIFDALLVRGAECFGKNKIQL